MKAEKTTTRISKAGAALRRHIRSEHRGKSPEEIVIRMAIEDFVTVGLDPATVSNRTIAEALDLDRKTVDKYIKRLRRPWTVQWASGPFNGPAGDQQNG